MPRLILINGMPAVGKTALARRYAEDHPLTLVLELDHVRRMLGRWREDRDRAALVARSLTIAMARQHLAAGYDVVIPQYLARPQFLDEVAGLGDGPGVRYAEFVLTEDRDTVLDRLRRRTAAAAEPAHVEAGEAIERAGGQVALVSMYDRLLLVVSSRPHARVLHSPEGGLDDVYRRLIDCLPPTSP